MGCKTCSTKTEEGCSTDSTEKKGGCANSNGCSNKMNSFDWLTNMDIASNRPFDIVEVRFKGGRKEFFKNTEGIDVITGDAVIVDVPNGHHLGHISLSGELVRLQMRKKNVSEEDENIKNIYRKASEKDIQKFEQAKTRETSTLFRARQIINELKLEMKLSDVEYQADNSKATFYYSADERVDFRELIKLLAGEFKIRIEMRQISLRQEAGRVGGIGSCGRELCCSTWLTDFKSVSTSAARYQNLSLNPSKLSGQCGRLKCCLNYELDTYLSSLKDIPEVEHPLKTQKGDAKLQKTDIFRKLLWFGYENENVWIPISAERVTEILELNKKNIIPATLEANEIQIKEDKAAIKEQNELARFDNKFKPKKKKKKKKGPSSSSL